MGNRISTHIALFQDLQTTKHLSDAQITNELLSERQGNTYSRSPYMMTFNETYLMSEVSFCEEWEPKGVFQLFKNHQDSFDKIFVRFNDEMGDCDSFFGLPSEMTSEKAEEQSKPGIYLFDQIAFNDFAGRTEIKEAKMINHYPNVYTLKIKGTFEAKTEIPLQLSNGLNSIIEETAARISNQQMEQLTTDDLHLINFILLHTDCLKFKYQGRTVHTILNTHLINFPESELVKGKIWWANQNEKGKVNINSCGWHNCGNPEFINYLEQRKQQLRDYLNTSGS